MQRSDILAAFNTMFDEFCDDALRVFPGNEHLRAARKGLNILRVGCPTLVCRIWYEVVLGHYADRIRAGDVDYFATNDYSADFYSDDLARRVLPKLDAFRKPLLEMGAEDKATASLYLQNLSALSDLYMKHRTNLNESSHA